MLRAICGLRLHIRKTCVGLLNLIIRLCLLSHALQFFAEAPLAIALNISLPKPCAVPSVFLLLLKLADLILSLKQMLSKPSSE